jgi:hypothetical protein
LYNIIIEFGIPMKLVRLFKICLNEIYSKVRIGKHLSDSFTIQNGLKQGDGWGDVDWIDLAQDRNRWRALVNSVLNLLVP